MINKRIEKRIEEGLQNFAAEAVDTNDLLELLSSAAAQGGEL